jgi:Redoxin
MRGCLCALLCLAIPASAETFRDAQGKEHDPFGARSNTHVFVFLRTDCPLANRYAPELNRLAAEFSSRPVDFWLVYSDADESGAAILHHTGEYRLPGTALLDRTHELARRAQATISPQAAVFDAEGHLRYSGRIDDRAATLGTFRSVAGQHDLEEAITATLAHKPVPHARTPAVGCYLADVK